MKATFVALGVVAVLAAAVPAGAGVTGNSALSREIAVKTAPSPSASTHSATPSASASVDDKGGLRGSRTAEPGDDKGGLRKSSGTHSARPSGTRTTEAGDDHGGRRGRGNDDNSGSDDNSGGSNSGSGKHGGSDDGPNHD